MSFCPENVGKWSSSPKNESECSPRSIQSCFPLLQEYPGFFTVRFFLSVRFGSTAQHRTVGFFALLKTAPHRTVGFMISENRTVGFTTSENRTEPHRSIYDFWKPVSYTHLTLPTKA